jgi:hypothetical protein
LVWPQREFSEQFSLWRRSITCLLGDRDHHRAFEFYAPMATFVRVQNAPQRQKGAIMSLKIHAVAAAALLIGTIGAAQASQSGPLVLNGQLSTSDFNGGVGDRYGAAGDDYYPSSYFVMRGNGFRGRGFGFPHGHGHGMGHGGAHGGGGHR